MTKELSYREALVLAQEAAMAKWPEAFVFGLDVADHKRIFGSTSNLVEKFGNERCFPTPLSEDAMTGVALGAAISGLRPIHVHIRSDFLLLGMNQLANMIASVRYMSGGLLKVPLTIRSVLGRGWGQGAQHSKTLHGVFAHIPGLKIVMPATAQDAYSLLLAAIEDENPVICLEHRWLYDVKGPVDTSIKAKLGEASIVKTGKNLTIVASSWMNVEALKVKEILDRTGFEVEIVDVRSISPLDIKTIVDSVKKTRNCLVVDYDWTFCGFSAELAAQISKDCFGLLERPVERMGFANAHCPTTRPLENEFYPNAEKMIRKIEEMFKLKTTDLSGEYFYSYENKFKGPF